MVDIGTTASVEEITGSQSWARRYQLNIPRTLHAPVYWIGHKTSSTGEVLSGEQDVVAMVGDNSSFLKRPM